MLGIYELAKLNGYTEADMQYFFDQASRKFLGDKFTDKTQSFFRKIGKTLGGKKGEEAVNKLIELDRKILAKEGKAIGNTANRIVKKTTGVDSRKVGDKTVDKIAQVQKNVRAKQEEKKKQKELKMKY